MLNAFKQVVDAVAYLHDNKVAHLDIRSSNIFVFEGKAVLSDFGFATKFPYYEKVSEFFD
jgi:serine/threonine protein kinase